MATFKTENGLMRSHPYSRSVIAEIKSEYPEAKLVLASDKIFSNNQIDVFMAYDIENEESYLWVWASSLETNKVFLIDEFFEMPKKQAILSVKSAC